MKISINGKNEVVPEVLSVSELLEIRDVESPDMVSVELNEVIISRANYASTLLNESDRLEFLYFMGGGK